ncbi:MAG: TolC family protein, partial [Pseudomonadota bacterium]|nr:TolC family protein [Pseudomonadota bacterium]
MIPSKALSLLCATTVLAGCMTGGLGGGLNFAPPHLAGEAPAPTQSHSNPDAADFDAAGEGEVVETLVARRSVLPKDGIYDRVADAALAAGSRAAEAELRSAKLRAKAENKNWLPTLSSTVSLTSLGETLASLVVDQVLYDNGKRKAERAYAAADVEVAAVTLSQDQNDRVYTALSLYLTTLRGQDKAAMGGKAISQMQGFKRIVDGRVAGGVSDKGDQRMVEGKLLDLRAARDLDAEQANTARAELQAMLGLDIPASDVAPLESYAPDGLDPLSVIKAEAEAKRTVAQATAERAGQLPGLSASGTLNRNGTSGALNAGTSQGLGFGTKARLDAIENSKETARENVVEARETARRNRSRLEQRLVSLQRQERETAKLVRESRKTFSLFQSQFK